MAGAHESSFNKKTISIQKMGQDEDNVKNTDSRIHRHIQVLEETLIVHE